MTDPAFVRREQHPHAQGLPQVAHGLALGLATAAHLDRHDAYGNFQALGDLVVTGPTHTNVNDFRAILIV